MIDENVLERLKPYLSEVRYPKGHVLFSSDKLERNIYFYQGGDCKGICGYGWQGSHDLVRAEGDVDNISPRICVWGERLRDNGTSGRFAFVQGKRAGFAEIVSG